MPFTVAWVPTGINIGVSYFLPLKEIKPYLHGGTENSIGTISFNLDDIEIDTKEIIDLETNELDIELLSSEEIENMYKEDTNNANSI